LGEAGALSVEAMETSFASAPPPATQATDSGERVRHMVISGVSVQLRRAEGRVQAKAARRISGLPGPSVAGRVVGLSVGLMFGLGGCSTLESINPVGWWHDLQGGKIAEQRPAPPGAGDAYPNLSTVPAKPAPPDRDAMKKLTDSLVADRSNARYTAEAAPIADPSSPAASPALFGGGASRPPPPTAAESAAPASASLSAASAPARTQAPPDIAPARAPVNPVSSAPLAPLPAAALGIAAESPPLPTREPPRPASAGASPPAPEPVDAPMPSQAAGNAARVQFPAGGNTLSPTGQDEVKQFAATRGNAAVSVVGYGEVRGSDPTAQTAALSLGMMRARAIAAALAANGVPSDAIRVGAEAAGRGAVLRLLR
jgi:outer membrane protein OmpA-like peptidoglycan-associated protein